MANSMKEALALESKLNDLARDRVFKTEGSFVAGGIRSSLAQSTRKGETIRADCTFHATDNTITIIITPGDQRIEIAPDHAKAMVDGLSRMLDFRMMYGPEFHHNEE